MSDKHTRREALLVALGAGLGLTGCGGGGGGDAIAPTTTDPAAAGWSTITQPSYVDVVVGTGGLADAFMTPGKTPTAIYSAWLYDRRVNNTKGTKVFENVTATWLLGRGRIFSGLEWGVTGMKVGGKRTVTAPASWCYGDEGTNEGIAPVPPKAALVIDVELLKVE